MVTCCGISLYEPQYIISPGHHLISHHLEEYTTFALDLEKPFVTSQLFLSALCDPHLYTSTVILHARFSKVDWRTTSTAYEHTPTELIGLRERPSNQRQPRETPRGDPVGLSVLESVWFSTIAEP